MPIYTRVSNGLVPLCINQNNLKIYGKLYAKDTLQGVSNSTSLNDLVEGRLLPDMSSIALWISTDTQYGQEVRKGTDDTSLYGTLIISRYNTDYHLTVRDYHRPVIYINTQSSVNQSGWLDRWYKIRLDPVGS